MIALLTLVATCLAAWWVCTVTWKLRSLRRDYEKLSAQVESDVKGIRSDLDDRIIGGGL